MTQQGSELLHSRLNFISHTRGEFGIGEISRRLMALLSAAGIQLNLVPFELNKSRNQYNLMRETGAWAENSRTISCVNADQIGSLISNFKISPKNTYSHIGFWSWELEDFPIQYKSASKLLDEIWTLSSFAQDSISKTADTLVRTVRVPVPIPKTKTSVKREDFGVRKNTFLVTSSFDFNSDTERKNPAAVISAFTKAFPKPNLATLIIKSINGHYHPSRNEELQDLAQSRPDIIFLDGHMNHYVNQGLLELADVYVGLHRSEGYGLNLADAMARKTAVVATGYSGNLDFMDDLSSILIPYEKVDVQNYAGIRVASQWANPDIEYAASKLRFLFENPTQTESLANLGHLKIKKEHSLNVAVSKFQKEFMNA